MLPAHNNPDNIDNAKRYFFMFHYLYTIINILREK